MCKKWIFIIAPALFMAAVLLYLLIGGAQDAARVEREVLRFHVVAASNRPEDQQIKIKVRDGVFGLVQTLFADCKKREEAMAAAKENQHLLQDRARQILKENGNEQQVNIEIGPRFFPTKTYGALSFPAGKYQAVSIRIGEAEGENFWCVLYPALCLSPAVADGKAADELAAVVGNGATAFLQKNTPSQKVRFALAEWWGIFLQKIDEIKK
jgi:stage II sporulation protein R